MNLQEWRKSNIQEATLPSGLQIKYNASLGIFDLAAHGSIPQVLLGAVVGEEKSKVEIDAAKMFKNLPDLVKSADVLIKASWLEPAVTDEPSETTIGIGEIPAGDKVHFFTLITKATGTDALIPFRAEPNGIGGASQSGKRVRSKTK